MLEVDYTYKTSVRFIDVDSYKILYHSKYFSIMEEARFAYMKEILGVGYYEIENSDVLFLVLSANAKYIKSAAYGDEVTVCMKVIFNYEPRITFKYVLYNQRNEKLFKGSVDVGYFSLTTGKLMFHHPKWILEKVYAKYQIDI